MSVEVLQIAGIPVSFSSEIDLKKIVSANKFETYQLFRLNLEAHKLQIAIELFDLYAESFGFSGTVFDSWYATTRLLTHIHKEGKIFYSEIKSNRNIFMRHPVKKTMCLVKPDGLVTLIKKHYWDKIKYVKFKTPDGSKVSHKTYSFEAKLKDCDVPIKFVIILGKWNKDDDYNYHILITNNLLASANALSKNEKLANGYFKNKSKRLKKKCAA